MELEHRPIPSGLAQRAYSLPGRTDSRMGVRRLSRHWVGPLEDLHEPRPPNASLLTEKRLERAVGDEFEFPERSLMEAEYVLEIFLGAGPDAVLSDGIDWLGHGQCLVRLLSKVKRAKIG